MSGISDISSILQNSLLLTSVNSKDSSDQLQVIKEQLINMPSVLDENSLAKFTGGEYDISLREYTSMNTYNTIMSALYGNNSANKFQNTLNILTNSGEDELANAKSFINKMKENGMSTNTAVRTYAAMQKYSVMSSLGNYNFVKAKV